MCGVRADCINHIFYTITCVRVSVCECTHYQQGHRHNPENFRLCRHNPFLHFQVSIIMRDGNESTCIVDNAAHVKRVSLSLAPHSPSHQLSRHGGWKLAGRRHPIPFERKAHSPTGSRRANSLSVEIIKAAEFSAEFSVWKRFLSAPELPNSSGIHCCVPLSFLKK